MVNTPHNDGHIKKTLASDNNELLHMLSTDSKKFSRTVAFAGLDYDTKRKKLDDFDDEFSEFIIAGKFKLCNTFYGIFREATKNAADHSENNMTVDITMTKNPEEKTITIIFFISDGWVGLPYTHEELEAIFATTIQKKEHRQQKGNKNRGLWLGMIKTAAELSKTDLILHNKGKIYHINNLGLQHDIKAQDKFGYQWIGIFELI